VRKWLLYLLVYPLLFLSCDQSCDDSSACNYGVSSEACKYADEEELLLVGVWNLVDIHDSSGECLYSYSQDFDCDLDQTFENIKLDFKNDKTCQIEANFINGEPSITTTGNWSINICENVLIFAFIDSYDAVIFPQSLPFGPQKILQLSLTQFLCEDLAGNILRWDKI